MGRNYLNKIIAATETVEILGTTVPIPRIGGPSPLRPKSPKLTLRHPYGTSPAPTPDAKKKDLAALATKSLIQLLNFGGP